MAALTGHLIAPGPADFTGWRLSADFEEATGQEPVVIPAHRSAGVAPDGAFSLALPDGWREPVAVTASTPSGFVAGRTKLSANEVSQPVRLDVLPAPPVPIEESPDPTLGRRLRYTGRVLDTLGTGAPADLLVVLWGTPRGGGDAYPLSVTRTATDGYFSDLWPVDELDGAYGVVQGGVQTSIPLAAGRLPDRILLVLAELPVPIAAESPDDCECLPAPPRVPDALDLAANPASYAADLGGCGDVTVPNRTVEEATFHAVVRTSEPEVKGVTAPEAVELSQPLAAYVATLVVERERLGTERERVVVERERLSGGTPRLAADQPVTAQATELMSARLTDDSGPDLRLDPAILSAVARRPDQLRSLDLIRAEHLTLRKQIGQAVLPLARPHPGRVTLDADHEIDWDETPTTYQATTIAHGHLLTLKQVWRADGYSLGDLLYSLPLAPGQRKRVAIVDWRREEVASRSAERRESERLGAQLVHDRDISQVLDTALRENTRGHSESNVGAVGGGVAGFIGAVVFGVGGGYASSSASAWQSSARSVAATSLSNMRDRTLQAASAVRSQRATVVQGARVGESVRAQTEVLANHNHCHAVTVEYFEVLRHFQVTNEVADVQECLFVPLEITPFTPEKALRHRRVLEGSLRRADLAGSFAALERVVTGWENAGVPVGRNADQPITDLDGELWLAFTLLRPRDAADDGFDGTDWEAYVPFLPQTPGVPPNKLAEHVWRTYLGVARRVDRDRIWNTRIAPRVARRIAGTLTLELVKADGSPPAPVTIDPTLVTPFAQDRPLLVTLRLDQAPPGLARAAVSGVRFTFGAALPGLARVLATTAAMTYRTAYATRPLFGDWRLDNDLSNTDDVLIPTPLDAWERRNPREEDVRRAAALLGHLNDHVEHYHHAIWWNMDPGRRHLLLDGYLAPNTGRSVAGAVENRLITIVGNCLVMPVAPGLHLDPGYQANGTSLLDAYATPPTPPARISVPTPGVFAEAMPGACNSCEVIDDTRFWRWEEAPIPGEPADILPLSTLTRRTTPAGVTADDFPAPIVRMQTAPRAPDPTGLAAALSLIGTPNLFRDLTGIDLTQANVAEAFKSTMSAAKEFGSQAAGLAQQRFQAGESERNLERIKQARKSGLITEEQASELASAALGGAAGQAPAGGRPVDNPSVQKLLDRAAGSPDSHVKITRSSGEVDVRTGARADGKMDFTVVPPVAPLKQSKPLNCWAAVGAMMLGWRDRISISEAGAAERAAPEWLAKQRAGTGLEAAEVAAFTAALGLRRENPQSYLPKGIFLLLEAHGPLWVIGDVGFSDDRLSHAMIVTGIRGDGTAEGTRVTLVDPALGAAREETYTNFARSMEAQDVVRLGLGIFHW
ncbi:Papain-like cysteine protease AvrRpt2 [Nonomuraea solani]|uniref:Papain-like cysteine protease AvrRpt2 n=1 Tax=Nonomuraea solani TaxID=1144553 RepID=A0A1H6E472_9ACTN|nr:papain-like cysteine protease family protein [Nonomuraea solani]SEG91806.1 Papain-like cysteine protease AvrRpt2 [Nonomuraea solani]